MTILLFLSLILGMYFFLESVMLGNVAGAIISALFILGLLCSYYMKGFGL